MTPRTSIIAATIASLMTFGAFTPSATLAQADVAMTDVAAQTVYSGEWTKKSFKTSGTWEIFTEGDKTFVKLSDDFRTRNAPDLKIFLSPQAASDATDKNSTDGAVLVAPLSSNQGGQVYEIPDGVDVSAFQSILIHCEAYSKLWSAADLTA